MTARDRLLVGSVLVTFVLSGALAACGGTPSTPPLVSRSTTTSTTSTTAAATAAATSTTIAPTAPTPTAPTTSTTTAPTEPDVAVPDVIGLKIDAARFLLYLAGLFTFPLTPACDKGTPTSQSVVVSLSVPGKPPDVNVGAVPLVAGSTLRKGSWIGITWSGCYPDGSVVPDITGLTFGAAVNLLHTAGLTWACYSTATLTAAHPTTTTTGSPKPSVPAPNATSSTSTPTTFPRKSSTTTTTTVPPTVLSQDTKAGTVLNAGTSVAFVMHHCPQ